MRTHFAPSHPNEDQKEPEGPALGTYPVTTERRATVGEKLARFLNDLAEKVRGWK